MSVEEEENAALAAYITDVSQQVYVTHRNGMWHVTDARSTDGPEGVDRDLWQALVYYLDEATVWARSFSMGH